MQCSVEIRTKIQIEISAQHFSSLVLLLDLYMPEMALSNKLDI